MAQVYKLGTAESEQWNADIIAYWIRIVHTHTYGRPEYAERTDMTLQQYNLISQQLEEMRKFYPQMRPGDILSLEVVQQPQVRGLLIWSGHHFVTCQQTASLSGAIPPHFEICDAYPPDYWYHVTNNTFRYLSYDLQHQAVSNITNLTTYIMVAGKKWTILPESDISSLATAIDTISIHNDQQPINPRRQFINSLLNFNNGLVLVKDKPYTLQVYSI